MVELRYTLVSDGSSDQSLIPILSWMLRKNNVTCAIQHQWADLRFLRRPPALLPDRILQSITLYPCDLLFVHRDAEREPWATRVKEVQQAVQEACKQMDVPPCACVVPVRMLEAWLLFSEKAIRRAAGNPSGTQQINLPRLEHLEALPDPKNDLYQLLYQASGLHGRRLKRFAPDQAAANITRFIEDFSTLGNLPAFGALERDLQQIIGEKRWDQ